MTSAVNPLGMESQPRVAHFPARHICLILFCRMVVSLVGRSSRSDGIGPDRTIFCNDPRGLGVARLPSRLLGAFPDGVSIGRTGLAEANRDGARVPGRCVTTYNTKISAVTSTLRKRKADHRDACGCRANCSCATLGSDVCAVRGLLQNKP
jgi:hypothetical protein